MEAGSSRPLEVWLATIYLGVKLSHYTLDGFVRIWSTEAIYNAEEPGYSKPKQLASMSYHTGTIHAVRFSGNGQYLASGADDKLVVVYRFDPNAPTQGASFGGQIDVLEGYAR